VIVSASCGIEGKRVIPYSPLLDRAIELAVHRQGEPHLPSLSCLGSICESNRFVSGEAITLDHASQ
jgi:hypothetical protein